MSVCQTWWATPNNPIALFYYQTFSEEDFNRYIREYGMCDPTDCTWAFWDFGVCVCCCVCVNG